MTSQICGCCGCDATVPILTAPDRDGVPVTICHCVECSALTPQYRNEAQDLLQSQTAFHERLWIDDSDAHLRADAAAMLGVIEFYRSHLPPAGSNEIVYDIGTGRGNLLAALLQSGFNAYGCEPSRQLTKRARLVLEVPTDRLITTTAHQFLDARQADIGNVRAIFLWHILEHIERPTELLKKLSTFLRSDGVIICQGPLLDPAYVFREHVFLHSESNIAWLAKSANLKLLMMECQSPERYASFVMALPEHSQSPCAAISVQEPLTAVGSLYFTLSNSLGGLRRRYEDVTKNGRQ